MTEDAAAPDRGHQIRSAVLGHMTGPGGPFELTTETVRGREATVLSSRHRSLGELAADAAKFGASEFMVLHDQRVTFASFAEQVAALSAGLRSGGVTSGDRVAIFAANRPEWVVTFFAVAELGAITVAMNGWWTTDEAHQAVDHTEPALIVGDRRRLDRLDPIRFGATPPLIVDFDSDEYNAMANHKPAASADTRASVDEDDPALILFTSGTTGQAKGALLSHRGIVGFAPSMILGAALRAATEMALAGQDPPTEPPPPGITLGNAPLFHVSGLFGHILIALATGAKVVYYEGRFEPDKILRLIQDEQINSFTPIGATGSRLINHPDFDAYDTSSVTRIGLGGAPTSPAMQDALRSAFVNASQGLGGGYGSSESTAVVCSQGSDEFSAGPERAGRPHPDVELEIRDDAGNPVPGGTQGHIWVRSPYTMLGYWNDADSTSEVIDGDGWLAMGDIGWLDADGYLTINSRARDMILRSAENIYPVEIENRLQAHPKVAEVAVIGADHPEHGQIIKAVVVADDATAAALAANGGATEQLREELVAWCRESLSAHKVPELWTFREKPLPRNASGKVMKRELS